MPTLIKPASWKWLAEHRDKSDAELLIEIKAFLVSQFRQAFELLRTQKLLSRSRSYERVKSLCTDLENWARVAPVGGQERKLLIGHCRITLGFQAMMSEMRERAKTLDIWSLSYGDFAAILISTLDAINLAYEAGLARSAEGSGGENILQANWDKNWLFRGLLDSALLILHEARKACSDHSDFAIGTPSGFVEALDVAKQTSEIMLGWDHYTFGGRGVSVSKNVIDATKTAPDDRLRSGIYRDRMYELDIAYSGRIMHKFHTSAASLAEEIGSASPVESFEQFLASRDGKNALMQLLPLAKELEQDLCERLDSLIDVGATVKIGKLRHQYRHLVSIWCYIVRVATVSRIWGGLIHSATGEYPPILVSYEALKRTFSGLGSIPEKELEMGIRHFTSQIDQREPIDLFYKPLLALPGPNLLIPAGYVLNSRFDRNLLRVVAREKSDSIAVKGKKPLRRLKFLFEGAGYRCEEEIQIWSRSGRLLTDLDLLASLGKDVFLFQSKVLSIPDSPYDFWRIDQALLSGAEQMDHVLSNRNAIESECSRRGLNLSLKDANISAYLLTDVMVHSGFKVGGYEVVDFAHLEHILSGARSAVMNPFSKEVVAVLKAIEGEHPTPDDIRRLIGQLRARPARPFEGNAEWFLEAGGWILKMQGNTVPESWSPDSAMG